MPRPHPFLRVSLGFLLCAASCELWQEVLDEGVRDCATRGVFYPDADGDGVGAMDRMLVSCAAPDGYVGVTGDCDDQDPQVGDCAGDDTATTEAEP